VNHIILDNGLKIKAIGLSIDSRAIKYGQIFCACAGSKAQALNKNITASHGIAYAGQAINQGAIAVLWEPTAEISEMPEYCQDIPLYKVDNLHKKIGALAAGFYNHPSQELQVIGVTGTNGKTSVTHFIAQLLTQQNKNCGLIGTLGNGLYGKTTTSSHTTPDAIQVQHLLSEMKIANAKTVAIEVSSHALHQNRVADVKFDIAVFTNLTREHLDYHANMENYANEKEKLFLSPGLKVAVINQDDSFAQQMAKDINREQTKIIGFSTVLESSSLAQSVKQNIDELIYSENIHYHSQGSIFDLCVQGQGQGQGQGQKTQVKLPLIGKFNISNALATAGVLYALDYDLEQIAKSLEHLNSVPGRMELIRHDSHKNIHVVVDYAHTPDALEQSIQVLKKHCKNKLWCVFGCGGNRDKGKRAEMARIAELNADEIVITSDNPRDEEPIKIIHDIEKGMNPKFDYRVEVDRAKAIELAIDLAEQDDVILIAGKGHETYQEINGVKLDFSDKDICLELLAA
jgi:UDP-N-acetylmuramoyl-L-alanyl-D-glutamate--2,6-diaminopimelate ligase